MVPIADEQSFMSRLERGEHHYNLRFRATVYSTAALSEAIKDIVKPPELRGSDTMREYLSVTNSCWALHGPASHGTLSIDDVLTCLNLNVVWYSLGDPATAWFYLQEAITIAQVLQVDQWSEKPSVHTDQGWRLKAYYLL